MANRPFVSILIPCWGCVGYIRATIDSALQQDYPHCEVIVVEDAGTDGTYEEACRIKDPRLTVVRNERNHGQYGNKNRALELARGDLVKYLDGDDLLEPDAVSRLVRAHVTAGPGVAVVFAPHRAIDPEGRAIGTAFKFGWEGRMSGRALLHWITLRKVGASPFGNVSPHVFERASLLAIGGFPDDNAGPGDLECYLKLLTRYDAAFIEEPTARYRCHPASMAHRTFGLRESKDYVRMIERSMEYFATCDNLPGHLHDPAFLSQWKISANRHQILSSLLRKLRRMPNEFDEIRRYYRELGLGDLFDGWVIRRFGPFILKAARQKLLRRLSLPAYRPLFTSAFRSMVMRA